MRPAHIPAADLQLERELLTAALLYAPLALTGLLVLFALRIPSRLTRWLVPASVREFCTDIVRPEDIEREEAEAAERERAARRSAGQIPPRASTSAQASEDGSERTPLLASPRAKDYGSSEGSEEGSAHAQPILREWKGAVSYGNLIILIASALHLSVLVALEASDWLLGEDADNSPVKHERLGHILLWAWCAARVTLARPTAAPLDVFAANTLIIFGTLLQLHYAVVTRSVGAAAGVPLGWHLAALLSSLAVQILKLRAVASMPLSSPTAADAQPPLRSDLPFSEQQSPEDSCTLGQWITYSWLEPLIQKAKTQVSLDEDKDIWKISIGAKARVLARRFREQHLAHPASSLLVRLIRANARDLLIDVALTVASSFLTYASPYLLRRILQSIEGRPASRETPTMMTALMEDGAGASREIAYLFAFFSFLCMIARSQADLLHLYFARRASVRLRSELMSAIYIKGMRKKDTSGVPEEAAAVVDKKTKDKKANGQKGKDETDMKQKGVGAAVALMASDSVRVSLLANRISQLVTAPLQIVIATTFLYRLLGKSAFAGILAVLFSIPLQTVITKVQIRRSRSLGALLDKRMAATGELISNLKNIRLSNWQQAFVDRVIDLRDRELLMLWLRQKYQVALSFLWNFVPSLVTVLSFASYTAIEGKTLSVSTAFTALGIFSMLAGPLSNLPNLLNELAVSLVAITRIEIFLSEDEVPDWVSSIDKATVATTTTQKAITCEKATFRWPAATPPLPKQASAKGTIRTLLENVRASEPAPKGSSETGTAEAAPQFELQGITLDLKPGSKTLVCGPTASGKSALLHALLGEMDLISGALNLPKEPASRNVSFAAQSPWLMHDSVRNNIVFGSAFDEERYLEVLRACALLPDLAIFPEGDEQEVGEGGIIMSGGQKARIALARAIYSPSRIVLLDDVLAACDAHVSKHLVQHGLCGPLMNDRTLLIATHHTSMLLPYVSHAIMLEAGRITAQGAPGDILDATEGEPLSGKASTGTSTPVAKDSEVGLDKVMVREKGFKVKSLFDKEQRSKGRVRWEVYTVFLKNAGLHWVGAVLLLVAVRKVQMVLSQFWLSYWASSYAGPIDAWPHFPPPETNTLPYILVFFLIATLNALTAAGTQMAVALAGNRAMRISFVGMLDSVLHASSRWLDTQPSGRIINRFSKDLATISTSLPGNMRSVVLEAVKAAGALLVVSVSLPAFLLPGLALLWIYLSLARLYNPCSRELRRLESTTRSPIFTGYTEVLRGITTVRAYCAEERLLQNLFRDLDYTMSTWSTYWMMVRWLFMRFDVLGAFSVFLSTALALSGAIPVGLAAISISQASAFNEALFWTTRHYTQLEQDLVSMERVVDMLPPRIPAEKGPVTGPKTLPAAWPSVEATIEFEDVTLRYAPGLPDVLHGVSFKINRCERVGICGRTGSGKSTIAMSLLRPLELSGGRILIEGLDLADVGLESLRSRIGLISQFPMLFSGTLRSNLDPHSQFSDDECREALSHVRLMNPATDGAEPTEMTLDAMIAEDGSNLSAGQRQLLAMARTILRKNRIVIADEATASLDFESDQRIQELMRTAFTDCILITVGHRLSSIIDYDRVLVMDQGKVAEFDTPRNLFEKQGIFYELCKSSGDFAELEARALGRSAS